MIQRMGGGGGGGGGGRAEVVTSKGCSRLFLDISSSFRRIPALSLEPLSPATSAPAASESHFKVHNTKEPFSGLVICVTGLSKEMRKQVKEATERLGGQYSPHLHPQCTHLVVQSFHGHKFEHASKHGPANGLSLVTIGWFVDSLRRNVRLNEALYSLNRIRVNDVSNNDLKRLNENSGADNSCLAVAKHHNNRDTVSSSLFGQTFYVDVDVPAELQSKVVEALSAKGASILDQWFVGCNSTYVVCEGPSVQKYLGHSSNLVTPLWVLKSAREKSLQRLVHLSADLCRYAGTMLDIFQQDFSKEEMNRITSSGNIPSSVIVLNRDERQVKVNLAKDGIKKRRNHRMQTSQNPIHIITPGSLLDTICWSISEPTSTASISTESSSVENGVEDQKSAFFDAKEDGKESESSFVNLSRPLTESEMSELIFKSPFLTIMFPVDRFSEMGPRSRTFFSSNGFTCLKVLDYIYAFYQENMSSEEIELAIHTDSRHADRLRSIYTSKETTGCGCVEFKRIDFLGSRKSFEMLKRVSGDNSSNIYELLIRA